MFAPLAPPESRRWWTLYWIDSSSEKLYFLYFCIFDTHSVTVRLMMVRVLLVDVIRILMKNVNECWASFFRLGGSRVLVTKISTRYGIIAWCELPKHKLSPSVRMKKCAIVWHHKKHNLLTWKASLSECMRILSRSLDSSRRRFRSLALSAPFFLRAIADEVKYVALRLPRQFP